MSIGSNVIWRGIKCMVTNTFRSGVIVISPKGNGKRPAKYYTVKEWEVVQCP